MDAEESKARALFEAARWPSGPVCPHCESENAYRLRSKLESKHRLRDGVLKCPACRRRFTVTACTIFAGSHVSLTKWILAIVLLCGTSQRVSALALQRELDLGSYRSALFVWRRIQWAINQPPVRKVAIPMEPSEALSVLLRVKPTSDMPKPGAHRRKSVWADVEDEMSRSSR